jgi:hypothetical protein
MKVGMMWYDGDKGGLAERLGRAVTYYHEKYGGQPNVCYVHALGDDERVTIDGVRVQPSALVLPGHMWLGEERQPALT